MTDRIPEQSALACPLEQELPIYTRDEAQQQLMTALVRAAAQLAQLYPIANLADVAATVCLGSPPRVVLTEFGDDDTAIVHVDLFGDQQITQ